jgi:putative ABC transport system permease protein
VSSLHKTDWRAHDVAAAFTVSPAWMAGQAVSWAAAVRVPQGEQLFSHRLSREFSNLSIFNITAFLAQLQDSLDQVTAAVEFLFSFTLAAGLLVLYAALSGSQDARMRQAALLRALGATRRQLSQAQWIEHLLTGALAGLLAATGASAASWALARFVFRLEWSWSPLLWLAGLSAGAVCALAGGWLGLRKVLGQPPLQTLRHN